MKLNNRFIFGLLSLLLAAVTAFVALPVIARQTNGKTEVVRVTAPILKGELVSVDNTETVEVGSYNLPSGTARSLDDVKGLYATTDLFPGDYILPAKVSPVPISSDTALNSIPSGKVAISLTIQTWYYVKKKYKLNVDFLSNQWNPIPPFSAIMSSKSSNSVTISSRNS